MTRHSIATPGQARWTTSLSLLVEKALLSVDLEGRYNFNANYLNSFYDQDRIALYKQDYAIHEQPVYADVLSQEPYRIRYDPQSLSDRDAFEQRPDVVWLREQFDVYERFGVRLSDNPSRCDLMAVTYDSVRGNITEKESSALMQIVPHLSNALNISTTFSILRARYQAALAAIERIKIGILLLDEHCNIILDNKAARKLTDFGSVFFVAGGKLKIRAEQSSNELSALITSAATTASGNGRAQGGTIMVTSPDTHKQYILDVSPLRDSTNELGDHFHGALVSIIDPDYSEQLDVSCLKNIYSLTWIIHEDSAPRGNLAKQVGQSSEKRGPPRAEEDGLRCDARFSSGVE